MNIDNLINNILDSYNKYGLINRSDEENFPNRQNVVKILQDLEFLIFPGFKYGTINKRNSKSINLYRTAIYARSKNTG